MARGRAADASPSSVNSATLAFGPAGATAATSGSSALSTTQPSGLVIRADRRLHLGQLGQGVDALQVEVVGRDVGQHARVVRLVADAAQDDPAAGGLEDGDVDVAARQDLVRAAGPVQSPGSTIRSSTSTPSEVVVPTCRPARTRMWVISRVTVLLPLVPEIDTIGIRRSASRSHVGGVVRAACDRARSSARAAAPGRRSAGRVRDGETSRSASASAASVIVWARSAPVHGKVTIQWPGSDERWTASPPRPSPWSVRSRRIQATIAAIGSGQSRGGHVGAEVDERVAARVALAVPGPPPADGDLELDHRLEPVDVRTFEQADLDQAHGPGRIASVPATDRLPADGRRRPSHRPLPSAAELDALRARDRRRPAGLPRRPRADSSTSTAAATRRAGVDEVGRWVAAFLERARRRRSRPGRTRPAASATRRRARSRACASGPRALLIGHMDTVFDPGTAAERPFRIEDGVAYGPGVTDMKSGLLAGLYALKAIVAERGGLPFERLVFIANPDEEIGSPTSTPHIAAIAADVRRRARPRMRPCERRHRLGAQGHPRPAHRRPRPGGARRRRAREGSQRDPRGGADRRASCTSSTAAGRASPSTSGASWAGRDRTSSPRRARSRSTSAPTAREALETAEADDPRDRRGDRGPRRDRRLRADGALVADGEARAQRPAGRARPGAWRDRSASRSPTPRPAARRTPTRRPGWASPSLDGLGPIGGNDHAPAEYLDVESIVPRTTTAGRPAAGHRRGPGDPRLAGRRPRRRERAPADLVGRAVGGRRPATAGRSSVGDSCWVAGTTDAGPDGTRAIPATPAPRRAPSSRSSSAPWPRQVSPWPTSCGRGCS